MEAPESPAPKRRSPLRFVPQLMAIALVASLLGLLTWRLVNAGRGGRLVAAVRKHEKPAAPDFRLKVLWPHTETWPTHLRQLVDAPLALHALRGYPVVVNFWASWCIPCKHEAPRFVASAREHAGQIVFLGLDIQDFPTDARAFLRHYHISYVSVRDGSHTTYDNYGLTGVPETYILDRKGRIIVHYVGETTRTQLEEGITQADRSGR